MISLLTVQVQGCKRHLNIMLESVLKRRKFVSEIIIVVADHDTDPQFEYKEWVMDGIKCYRIPNPYSDKGLWFGHGTGLKAALEKATQDYVMFTDPDVFWYMSIDEFYLDLMKRYKIDYIGVSHHNAINQAFSYFPCVMNSLVRRRSLPNNEWLSGVLKYSNATLMRTAITEGYDGSPADGQFLIPNPLPKLNEEFPNKKDSAIFDVGCNLWLWSQEQKWKWLSFQTLDCHCYMTFYTRSNFKFLERFKKQPILYHLSSSARNAEWEYNGFIYAYNQSLQG